MWTLSLLLHERFAASFSGCSLSKIQNHIRHRTIGKTIVYRTPFQIFFSNPSKDKMVAPNIFNTLYVFTQNKMYFIYNHLSFIVAFVRTFYCILLRMFQNTSGNKRQVKPQYSVLKFKCFVFNSSRDKMVASRIFNSLYAINILDTLVDYYLTRF